jgi:large subunit ribosomal protein L21
MAFAIIETGGKQYRVSEGSRLTVERLDVQPGDTFSFDRVLLVQDGVTSVIGAPIIAGAVVQAEVLREFRGEKIRVATYKPKKRQRRTLGHRQSYTELQVGEIVMPDAEPKKRTSKKASEPQA